MLRIKNLYKALCATQVPEDQCTNFLVYLLNKLPSKVFIDLIKLSGLPIPKTVSNLDILVQYTLEKSRLDALIGFNKNRFLIIETKKFPNSFDEKQFSDHLEGASKEFGRDNILALFISGDTSLPTELASLSSKYGVEVGFIGWQKLLDFFEKEKENIGERYEIIIEEFINFAKLNKLGSLVMPTSNEIMEFLELYPKVAKYQPAIQDKFEKFLTDLKDKIIIECEEKVVENSDEKQDKLPSLYKTLTIKKWHTKSSSYLFLNILSRQVGIVLTGYQKTLKERETFLGIWDSEFKAKYKQDPKLKSFTWVDKGEDEYSIDQGYFKEIVGTSGKSFNPAGITALKEYFYWGYSYPLDPTNIDSFLTELPKDYKKLIDTFSM